MQRYMKNLSKFLDNTKEPCFEDTVESPTLSFTVAIFTSIFLIALLIIVSCLQQCGLLQERLVFSRRNSETI